MSYLFIYTTFGSEGNAREVARALLEARLVSCANIFPAVESMYHWENKIQQDTEVVVIFKAPAKNFEKIETLIQSLHTYDTPCVVALPIEKGAKTFLDWITKETSD